MVALSAEALDDINSLHQTSLSSLNDLPLAWVTMIRKICIEVVLDKLKGLPALACMPGVNTKVLL